MSDPAQHIPAARSVDLVNERTQIEALEAEITAQLEQHGYPRASLFAFRLAFEEALTNAFKHGHAGQPEETPVTVEYRIGGDHLRVTVEDRGPGFDPGDVPDPTLDENLTNPHGRGIMLMRAYMTRVTHNERGNRIELYYEHPSGGSDRPRR
jgi:serine/threonine-protein kinase RsbW